MSPLLNLPPELRSMIYDKLTEEAIDENKRVGAILEDLPRGKTIQYLSVRRPACTKFRPQGPYDFSQLPWSCPVVHCLRAGTAIINLAKTCKFIYTEITFLFRRKVDFSIQGSSFGLHTVLACRLAAMSDITAESIEYISLVLFKSPKTQVAKDLRVVVDLIVQHLPNVKAIKLSLSGVMDLSTELASLEPKTLADVGVLNLLPSRISVSISIHPEGDTDPYVWTSYCIGNDIYTRFNDLAGPVEQAAQLCRGIGNARKTKKQSDDLGNILAETLSLRD